jgi:HK97 family phage prohead protease
MQDRLQRAFPGDLEIRGGDGRTITGIAAPFDSPAAISDIQGRYTETIERGAFARTIAERGSSKVKLLVQHESRSLPIGRAHVLREDTAGLYGEFKVSKTERGDEVLELVRDGALDAFSIGFRPIRDHWSADGSTRTLLEARLDEVSVVSFPAYEKALISAVRQATAPNLLVALQRLHELRK